MQRKFLRNCYDAMGDLVYVVSQVYWTTWFLLLVIVLWLFVFLLAAFSALRPTAELRVGASGFGFGLRGRAAEQGSDVNFVSTVRAFHLPNNTTPNAYDA